MRLIVRLLILSLVVSAATSCVSKKKFDEMEAAKMASDKALAETQAQLKNLKDEKDKLAADFEAEKTRLNGEISKMQTDLNATKGQMAQVQEKLNMTEGELKKLKDELNGLFAGYKDSGLSLEERDGRLYVLTSEPVNYRSGSSRLSKSQRDAVDAMAETLKKNPNLKILVEGHTDNKQFASGSGMDNWQLSLDRARKVVDRLIKKGVPANQVAISGRGESMPAGDNSTKEGRAKNRRTVVLPNPDLGNLIKN